jgi:pantetheine-phosphate adenylyltransferase
VKRFSKVCLGGTFDQIHLGHKSLLKMAFSTSDEVIIGLTSDKRANLDRVNEVLHTYEERYGNLNDFLTKTFSERYSIVKLNDVWGPGIFDKDLEAIIVSEETKDVAFELNKNRKLKNLGELEVITIPLILAKDGKKISSTRIRNNEIDINGLQA